MSELLNNAIDSVRNSRSAFCRFITGNDAGTTGGHQGGFYVPKDAAPILFEKPGQKGENKQKSVVIRWQNDFSTDSHMKYYGRGTRNEYRITYFGRNFPFLQDEYVGSLLVLSKFDEENYSGFVLSADEDIDDFLNYFSLSPNQTNHLIDVERFVPESVLNSLIVDFVAKFDSFPETVVMAVGAQGCYNTANRISDSDLLNCPDKNLLAWIDTEYALFKRLEDKVYSERILRPFTTVEDFVQSANEILNRRKARAGKSLEHHLATLFKMNKLVFEEQAVTEDNKKPDFLFPNSECYHNLQFPGEDLVLLGAKTTCKDRWRQVLTEGDRIFEKHLFTLQQGISRNQLREMRDSRLTLVVPSQNIQSFPREYQSSLMDLKAFISYVSGKQEQLPKHFVVRQHI